MTDQSAQEPTMEEILASIRRIISEDDAPAETAAAAPATPEPAPTPAPAPAEIETPAPVAEAAPEPAEETVLEDDVLELTERYDPPAAETIGDLDVAPAAYAPEPEPAPVAPLYDDEPLVGAGAASSAASAFAGLSASLRQPAAEAFVASGPTVEELARQLLRPMLKEWLDAHLPGIVEAQVRKEVERIARNAG